MTKSDQFLAAIRVWMAGPENGGWRTVIMDGPAKIAVNPSTRHTTLFRTLIATSNSVFLAPFTRTAGDNEGEKIGSILSHG